MIVFSDELSACGLQEGIKAISFFRVRPHGSSIDGPKLWPSEAGTPNEILTAIFDSKS
jgi:hypothetical protein